ncbi:MAG TPA: class II aldolase/adducin family protein [Thermoleophilaceae bacterium]|nr:class II aldolase/adducin family protein [Thermoleophilaceae bacterium]
MSTADLRSAVVEAAREMLRLGLVTGTSGNVSARDADSVLITPAALAYEEMSEEDVVELGRDGEAVEEEATPSSERRVHTAVYAARPDIGAIVHTHSVHATAWSFLDEPLDTGTEELEAAVGGSVMTARYAPTGTDEIAAAAAEALGDRGAVLLGRHGVVAVGESPAAALATAVVVERQAQMAWLIRGRT